MNRDPINHPDAFTPPTAELDPALRELLLLVNAHGSPVARRALADLRNEEHRLRKLVARMREAQCGCLGGIGADA